MKEEDHKFEASLECIVRPCPKRKKGRKEEEREK
jgi:hypothetical protein